MTKIEKELKFLRAYCLSSTLVLAVAVVWLATHRGPGRILEVERLDVVNHDGQVALALGGHGQLPGPMIDHKQYPAETSVGRTSSAGMIFFNESGDEVGGLTYGGAVKPGGYDASFHLSMDQWKQDQVVVLEYGDDGQRRRAGLSVSDRPTDLSLSLMMPKLVAWKTATGAEREGLDREFAALKRDGKFGASRVFLGAQDQTALLSLKDKAGKERIRMSVGPDDVAHLEFLDAAGKVTTSLP